MNIFTITISNLIRFNEIVMNLVHFNFNTRFANLN